MIRLIYLARKTEVATSKREIVAFQKTAIGKIIIGGGLTGNWLIGTGLARARFNGIWLVRAGLNRTGFNRIWLVRTGFVRTR